LAKENSKRKFQKNKIKQESSVESGPALSAADILNEPPTSTLRKRPWGTCHRKKQKSEIGLTQSEKVG
jgi:hypothetical protein